MPGPAAMRAVVRHGPDGPWRQFAACSVAMAAGMTIDLRTLDPQAIATLCSPADGLVDRAWLHMRLLPATHVAMLAGALLPWPRRPRLAGRDEGSARSTCSLSRHLLCASAMLLGMMFALPLGALWPPAGAIGMFAAMLAGMAAGAAASAACGSGFSRDTSRQYQRSNDTPTPR